jgi:hypothetical protein
MRFYTVENFREMIFLGACAQLPTVKALIQAGTHDDYAENVAAVRRAEAVWEFVSKQAY